MNAITSFSYLRTPNQWFVLFLLLHLIIWTLVPNIIRYNLPLDTIESTIWAQQLAWGYDRNSYF